MTLDALLNVVKNTKFTVTVRDANEVELIKFYTGGESSLSATLLARTVAAVKVDSANALTVDLESAKTQG